MGYPMGMNYAPLVTDLFLFSVEREFMMYLSEQKQSEVIEAFSSTSRHLDIWTIILILLSRNLLVQRPMNYNP